MSEKKRNIFTGTQKARIALECQSTLKSIHLTALNNVR